jgi:hypothetical protein
MSWVRIHDGAMFHPKVISLTDKAFRLWVWGLSYCQAHLTDGVIPAAALPPPPKTADALVRAQLWAVQAPDGFLVHDYLDWNDSKTLVQRKRADAKARMANVRQRSSRELRENFSREVLRGLERDSTYGSDLVRERGSGGKPAAPLVADAVAARASALLAIYAELYPKYRNGARLRLIHNSVEFHEACSLVELWDLPRLEKLAVLVLTTDDPFIQKTDRSFKIFAMKASWADDKLTGWEAAHGVTA